MKVFFKLGLVRGLIFQIIGTVIGIGIVDVIRMLMGLPFAAEPAAVFGAILGGLTFLVGVGAVTDWWKWAMGEETPEHPEPDHSMPELAKYFGVSLDHKVIGVQYGVASVLFLAIAGTLALIFRVQLAQSGLTVLQPDMYNTMMGMHGMVMIVATLLGGAAMSNYLVPLLIGAKDMAFPRLNAFSFWIAVPAGLILTSALFVGGFDTGWVAYPPLSARAPLGMQMFFVGVFLAGWSSILGGINIIVTTFTMRPKSMTAFKMPIFVWASLATSLIAATATQFIGLSFQMVMFQRLFGMGFFDPDKGGNPILFQHLFWFYSHPAVYVFVLPGLGIISELLPVFARKPLFGYKWVAMSSMGIALVGYFVWAHHMFTSGMEEYLRVPFMYSTLLVAIPTGVKFFSWVATLWEGKIRMSVPLMFTLGAVSVFLLGGLSGPPNGTVSTDLHLHDTYWIVGHFHATMFGGFVFPFIAAVYYWFPKITGRKMNDTIGKIQFWLLTPGFWLQSLGMMKVGLLGMRRRIFTYDPALGLDSTHLIISVAGFAVGLSVLLFIINIVWSARKGQVAVGNIWESRSPEWALLPNPAPEHNYEGQFVIVGEPYDYGLPNSTYVRNEAGAAVPAE
jgi:cytochrome c oxidase subunit 1